MVRDTDIVRAMKLAIKHLRKHQRKYAFNANLWKLHAVTGCEGEANRYDEIQFAIDQFDRTLLLGDTDDLRNS